MKLKTKIKKKLSNFLSDRSYINLMNFVRLKRLPNLRDPKRFTDKMQWLKLNWTHKNATKYADKYEVRKIIEEKIGSSYLNSLLGVYDHFDEIDFSELPQKFVIKVTHGSGYNIICHDKDAFNIEEARVKVTAWLKEDYFKISREPVYKNIKPRIIIEEFLDQGNDQELRDYRFFCFNGEPKFITVDFNINNKKNTRRNLYDLNWNLMKETLSYPQELNIEVEKPKRLEEMLHFSRVLSAGFEHARVDFYYINNEIIFGEITFFHQSGMPIIAPDSFDFEMGELINVSKRHKKN